MAAGGVILLVYNVIRLILKVTTTETSINNEVGVSI